MIISKIAYIRTDVELLIRRLDGLPLALAQAGGFLRHHKVSVTEYILLLDEHLVGPLPQDDPMLQGHEGEKLSTTWGSSKEMAGTVDPAGEQAAEDSDTEPIYAESIFSEASAASSLSSLGGSMIPDHLVTEIARTLFCTKSLVLLNAHALQDRRIGHDRFGRNVRRLVVKFGRWLVSEAASKDEYLVARMLQSRSISSLLAREIVETMEQDGVETLPVPDGAAEVELSSGHKNKPEEREDDLGAASEDFSDEGEEEELSYVELRLKGIEGFLSRSQAYARYVSELAEYTHGPYQQKITAAIGRMVVSEAGVVLDSESVKGYAREISWVPPNKLQVSSYERISVFDNLKGWIEDVMGETWDWWPLRQRKRPLADGLSRLRWQSVSSHMSSRYDFQPLKMLWAAERSTSVYRRSKSSCGCHTRCTKISPSLYGVSGIWVHRLD